MSRTIWLTNSQTGKREKLETLKPGVLTMYSCGPTVYGLIHIGNLRTAVVSDMFFRYFKSVGYEVNYVRNYTDIDDKIINRANKEGVTHSEISKKYISEVEKDYAMAGMLDPTKKSLATETITEMHEMIQTIIDEGKAYVVDGEVLFSVKDFEGYGKLSGRQTDDLIAGARVEVNDKKRNPLDFSLWKPAKPGEPSWDSPWGKGRPGWHIECSAMSRRWLGDQIDIHHGGADLIFPHHENEIAQSEAATGKAPFVKIWVHNALLNMNKEKMSKSVGNILPAREFLAQYSGEFARYLYLSVHYRSVIDFGDETIDQALTSLARIYETKEKAVALSKKKAAVSDMKSEELWGSFVADCEKAKGEIDEAFANDLNTAEVVAVLFRLIREFNRIHAQPMAANSPGGILAASELIGIMEQRVGEVLGFGLHSPEKGLADLNRMRASRSGSKDRPTEDEIKSLIQERIEARKAKDFKRSDEIRDALAARGVVLKDSPQGTTWTYT